MTDIDKLLNIMRNLRDPKTGCPWDLQQDFSTIAPYTIEEAYEVQQAILQKDYKNLCLELGDLLLQVVFHAQMAEEAELFNFQDVVDAISEKMTRRHPHVFGDKHYDSMQQQHEDWERIKRAEKSDNETTSLLSALPIDLPALKRAQQIQAKAASVGFDWTEIDDVIAKIDEEIDELKQAVALGEAVAIQEEIGDALFSVVNLARKLSIDAEYALQSGNQKFIHRFQFIEQQLAEQGQSIESASLEQMESLWQLAKEELMGDNV